MQLLQVGTPNRFLLGAHQRARKIFELVTAALGLLLQQLGGEILLVGKPGQRDQRHDHADTEHHGRAQREVLQEIARGPLQSGQCRPAADAGVIDGVGEHVAEAASYAVALAVQAKTR